MHTLVKYALYDNHWLWFHILAGGVLAKIGMALGLGQQLTLIIIGVIAILYEIYQWITGDIVVNEQRAILDGFADIAGAWLMALVVVV